MNKKEVLELVELISKEYPQYKRSNAANEDMLFKTANRYYEKLKTADYQEVKDIYFKYSMENDFPPRLANLIPRKRVYKTPEETSRHLDELENKKPLSKEELAEWHKKILASLGVKK